MKNFSKAFLLVSLALFAFTALFAQRDNNLFRVNVENSYEVFIADLLPVFVTRVVDGDTIIVSIENPPDGLNKTERVRFLGVDAPETVHPNRKAERFGKESSEFSKKMLEKKFVYLAFDWDLRDRYGRLLAYVYLEDRACFNAIQLKHGYVYSYNKFPFRFSEEFQMCEYEAKINKFGLWEGF